MTGHELDQAYAAYVATQDSAQDALLAVVRRYVDRVAWPHLRDRDDIIQQVTISVWQSLSRYRGKSKFSTWLYHVVRNRLQNSRRGKHLDQLPEGHEPVASSYSTIEQSFRDCRNLPKDIQRIANMLTRGYTLNEIAAAQGCSVKTLRRKIAAHVPNL